MEQTHRPLKAMHRQLQPEHLAAHAVTVRHGTKVNTTSTSGTGLIVETVRRFDPLDLT